MDDDQIKELKQEVREAIAEAMGPRNVASGLNAAPGQDGRERLYQITQFISVSGKPELVNKAVKALRPVVAEALELL